MDVKIFIKARDRTETCIRVQSYLPTYVGKNRIEVFGLVDPLPIGAYKFVVTMEGVYYFMGTSFLFESALQHKDIVPAGEKAVAAGAVMVSPTGWVLADNDSQSLKHMYGHPVTSGEKEKTKISRIVGKQCLTDF